MPFGLQTGQALVELGVNVPQRSLELLAFGDEMLGGVDRDGFRPGEDLTGDPVKLHDSLDLVAEEADPQAEFVVGGDDLQGVPAHAKRPRMEVHVIAFVL